MKFISTWGSIIVGSAIIVEFVVLSFVLAMVIDYVAIAMITIAIYVLIRGIINLKKYKEWEELKNDKTTNTD